MVIFDQWHKLHLGLDALSNQKILKGIYCLSVQLPFELLVQIPVQLLLELELNLLVQNLIELEFQTI